MSNLSSQVLIPCEIKSEHVRELRWTSFAFGKKEVPSFEKIFTTSFVHSVHPDLMRCDYSTPGIAKKRMERFAKIFRETITCCGPWDLVEYEFNHSYIASHGRIRVEKIDIPWTNPWTNEKKTLTLDLQRLKIIDRENNGIYGMFGMYDRSGIDYRDQETTYLKLIKDEKGILHLVVVSFAPLVLRSQIPQNLSFSCLFDQNTPCSFKGTINSWCLVHHGDPNTNSFYKRQIVHNHEKKKMCTEDLFTRAQLPASKPIIYVFENVFNILSPEQEALVEKKMLEKKLEEEEKVKKNLLFEKLKEDLRKDKELKDAAESERIRLHGVINGADFPALDVGKILIAKVPRVQVVSEWTQQGSVLEHGVSKSESNPHGTDTEPMIHGPVKKLSRKPKYTKVNLRDL